MKTWNALGAAAVGLVLGVGAPCAHASYLTVNGACIASINPGCAPDLQTAPGANQLNLDNTFTLADGDSYLITGTVFVDTYFPTRQRRPMRHRNCLRSIQSSRFSISAARHHKRTASRFCSARILRTSQFQAARSQIS